MLLRRTSAQLQRLSSARASCTAPVATPTRLPAVPRRCPSSTRAIVTAPFGYAHPARYAADREAGQNFATEHGWHGLHEQSVSWGEVDRFQHLNNVHTLKYFENGRMAFLMELLPELDEGGPATQASIVTGAPGVGIILSKVEARYRVSRPVRLSVVDHVDTATCHVSGYAPGRSPHVQHQQGPIQPRVGVLVVRATRGRHEGERRDGHVRPWSTQSTSSHTPRRR